MPKPDARTPKPASQTRKAKAKISKPKVRIHKAAARTPGSANRNPIRRMIDTLDGLSVIGVLAVGLMAVSGFLLFGFSNQLHTDQERLTQSRKLTAEFEHGTELIQTLDTGALKSDADLRQLGFAFTRLSELSAAQPMDADYLAQTESWCREYQDRLAGETGQISTYQFTVAALQENQTLALNLYRSFADYLDLVCSSISNWNRLSVDGRSTQLAAINDARSKVIVVLAQLQAAALQGRAQIQSLQGQEGGQVALMSAQVRAIRGRIMAAWIGVSIGLALLAFVIVQYFALRKNQKNRQR